MVGWWLSPTPLKNDGVNVSWGPMTFPTEWKVIKFMFQTTNQMVIECKLYDGYQWKYMVMGYDWGDTGNITNKKWGFSGMYRDIRWDMI